MKRPRWLLRGLVGAGVLLVGGELLLRSGPGEGLSDRYFPRVSPVESGIKEQEKAESPRYIADPELGNRYLPLRRDSVRTPDYRYLVETDSAGFPNREPWPDRLDAVVLGNSLVIGPGVGVEGQFSSVLARELGGARVLNLGLAGASPEHQLRIYRRYARDRRSRAVIATLWVSSDVGNALRYHEWLAKGNGRDFYEFRTTYGEEETRDPKGRSVKRLFRGMTRTAVNARATLRRGDRYREVVTFPDGDTTFLSGRAQERLGLGMARAELPGLPEVFFGPLASLRAEAESAGARFVVGLIPSKEELYGAEHYPGVLRTIRDVRRGLDSAGIPALDLYQPVRREAGSASPFFPRDIHLNRLGNEIVGKALARWVADSSPAGP